MNAARESTVVSVLRGRGGNETAVAIVKKQKHALARWNALAASFPYAALPAVSLGFVICHFAFDDLASYLFVGSSLSLLAEALVIASYIQLKSWRKHPSRLLLYRSLSNVVFAVSTIANSLRAGRSDSDGDLDDSPNSAWCVALSFFTQLAFFAGECWLVVISLDLVVSLSNPFSSIYGNLNKYKLSVWSASGISALALITSGQCQGVTTDHVCWLHVEDLGSSCLWAFVLGWVAIYYIFSAAALGYAFVRISRGLESTYEARKACAVKHLSVLLAYVGYAFVLLILYVAYIASEEEEGDANSLGDKSETKILEHIIALLIGSRGVVDALLWFRMHSNVKFAPSLNERAVSIGGRLLSMVSTANSSQRGDRATPLLPPDGNSCGTATGVAATSGLTGGILNTTTPYEAHDNGQALTASGGSTGLAFRLWNGGSYTSGDGLERDSCARTSSAVTHGHRLSNIAFSEDRYGSSIGGPSGGPVSIAANEEEHDSAADDDLWVDHSLNPQLNLALRQEVLHFVTQGILHSLRRATSMAPANVTSSNKSDVSFRSSASDSFGEEKLDRLGALPSTGTAGTGASQSTALDPAFAGSRTFSTGMFLESLTSGKGDETTTDAFDYSFQLDNRHHFRDRFPLVFRRLRALVDISDEWYAHQIALPARERLAEGGSSGAFMFFCGAGEFMVKTVSAHESSVLCSILSKYARHLSNNPNSMLVRFLGLHELRMYNQTFYFVVMKNIFPPAATINLKYDIKGSWVNRSASGLMPPGTRSYCKHCGEPFRVGTAGNCPDRIGVHEPNLVLKDNDLTTKIRMKPEEAYGVIDALHKDSDALCQMGITDYSLLVGVRNLSYDVDPEVTLNKRNKSFVLPSRECESTGVSAGGGPPLRDLKVTDIFPNAGDGTGFGVDAVSNLEDEFTEKYSAPSDAPTFPISVQSAVVKGPLDFACDGLAGSVDPHIMQGGYAARAVIAPGIYYFGIVDILQTWSVGKIAEKVCKVYLLGMPEEGISCMHPEPYKERFQRKVSEVVEHAIFVRQVTGSWKGKREVTGPTSLIHDP